MSSDGTSWKRPEALKIQGITNLAYVDTSGPPDYEVATQSGGVAEEDEEMERETWNNWTEFILSCIGYCVGLGNVWRFPYVVYQGGGGAFVLAYLIMMAVVGVPMFMMELSIGQYSSEGPATCWRFAPLFRGDGFGMLAQAFIGSLTYNMIMVWSIYYLFFSFRSELPWKSCGNEWNSDMCYEIEQAGDCAASGKFYVNGACLSELNSKQFNIWNTTNSTSTSRIAPSEDFYKRHMLQESSGIEDLGGLRGELVICLAVAWLMTFLCIIKGIKSSGKVVYFTALFPYVILLILFFRAITLPGAGKGVEFYLKPDFSKLADASVWGSAAGQVFFSLSVGAGGLMTFGSYNKFNNNVFRDTLIVCVGDAATAIFAGFVIFPILGYMAFLRGVEVDEVVTSGSGLAFVAYPEVVLHFPLPQLWAVLFFVMLLLLGLDSEFANVECILTCFTDMFPKLRKTKTLNAAVYCFFAFCITLPMCTQGGIYIIELLNTYASGWALVLIAFCECVTVGWVYRPANFLKDISAMIGERGKVWHIVWTACWMGVTPLVLLFMIIVEWATYSPLKYDNYTFPDSANVMGWLVAFMGVIPIPVYMVYAIITFKPEEDDGLEYGIWDRMVYLSKPSKLWRPRLKSNWPENQVTASPVNGGNDNTGYSNDGKVDESRM